MRKWTIELGNDNSGQYLILKIPVDTLWYIYIPANFAFNLPHYVTTFMHHTEHKKENPKKLRKICFKGIRSGTLRITSVSADNSSFKGVYIPSLWWLTVFKDDFFAFFFRISNLFHAAERLRNLGTNDRVATDWTVKPYDCLPVRKVSFHRSEKTLTQHCSSLFLLFYVRVANHLAFRVRRAADMTSLLGIKKNNMAVKYMTSF